MMNDWVDWDDLLGLLVLLAIQIAFIALRIAGVIGWHWAWVLAPSWGPLALSGLGLAVVIIYCLARGDA